MAEIQPGDVAYIPIGFGHAVRNTGDEDLEIVQAWDNGKFEEIDPDKWVASSPRCLLANNFAGVAQGDIKKLKKARTRFVERNPIEGLERPRSGPPWPRTVQNPRHGL